MPLLTALVVISGAAVTAAVAGLAPLVVVAVTSGVALGGGIIARRTVAALLGGIGMFVIRPYAPGERVLLPTPGDDGLIEAQIVGIGLVNSTLATSTGLLVVANSYLLHGLPADLVPTEKSMQA